MAIAADTEDHAARPPAAGTAAARADSAWAFARHWQFWLALALGAFLRLWHIEQIGRAHV